MILYNELAEYYFTIESSTRDITDDIKLILSFSHDIKEPELLDIGCGTGEHLNIFSRYGIKSTGIDSSNKMLDIAKERFPSKIKFFNLNLKDFDFYNQFDIITCMFGSFDYLLNDEDIDSALWNTWRALKSDGIAIFEVWHSIPVVKIKKKKVALVSNSKFNDTIIERYRGFNVSEKYRDKTIVEVDYKYQVSNNQGVKNFEDKHTMRAFTKEEFLTFLNNNGFKVINIFSNSLKAPFTENSNKMFIIFKKK